MLHSTSPIIKHSDIESQGVERNKIEEKDWEGMQNNLYRNIVGVLVGCLGYSVFKK